jgi:transcriptional regulator with XRE-family HTH domain
MCKALELKVDYSAVSNYERGTREPPLQVLLRYARIAGVYVDVLIDDDLDLPSRLPTKPGYEWVMKPLRVKVKRK